ncbi:MAG TPA: hypothetical protein DGT23_20985 [Micromonosporaceae bacterium]|nr:hypothetical protein [Micromonosporaceae bacterium]
MLLRESLVAATIGAVLVAGSPTSSRVDVVPNFGPGRHFLLVDAAGDGRAVEAIGDVSTAERIVVVVPGSDTTLANFDRGLGGVARRAPAVQARNIYEATARSPRVAVVAWLGYDPPEGLGVAAMRQDRAESGARELIRFIASLPPNATVTLVGHSYGSVVVGLAAPSLGPQVTDIVALASPGMGASTVSDLRTSAHVWTAIAAHDWIRRVPRVSFAGFGHGPLPADARPLPTDGVDGHDGYLVPGSSTLEALIDIVLSGHRS